jgi:ADP-heptose:LPS heptosyltransferase
VLHTDGPWDRVAVLRPGRIGDYLCATPAVRALRRAVAGARLDYIGLELVRDLVERNPNVDRFVAFPGFPYVAEQFFEPRRALGWLVERQAERYDLVIQLYGSGVYTNPIALLIGGRRTAGFVRHCDEGHPLDAAIPLPSTGPEVDRVLALVRHLGAREAGRHYDLHIDPDEGRPVLAGLPRPVVGLHCGARDADRRLPTGVLARVAGILRERYGASAVVLGGEDERPIGAALGHTAKDLTGRLPLALSAAVIAALDVLVTTDSGPAHLGYAAGTPSVTVFTVSDPGRWGPPVPGPHLVVDGTSATAETLADAASRALTGTRRSSP